MKLSGRRWPWGAGRPPRTLADGDGAVLAAVKGLRPWMLALKTGLILTGLLLLLHWASQRLPHDAIVLAPWSLLGAIGLNQLALFAAAWRLQATLAAFGVHIGRSQAIRIHLQSLFYFFFVPMSVGLEIARFAKVRALDPGVSAKRLFLALLLDRVLGLVAAVAVVGLLLPVVVPDLLPRLWHPSWLVLVLAGTLTVAGALRFSASLRQRLTDAVVAMAEVRRTLPILLGLSMAALLLVCASVYLIALGAGIAIGPVSLTLALSSSLLGMLLPVSVLGATLGEAAGAGVFGLMGLSAASALLLVSSAYAGRLLGALQGGLIELYIDGRRATDRASATIDSRKPG